LGLSSTGFSVATAGAASGVGAGLAGLTSSTGVSILFSSFFSASAGVGVGIKGFPKREVVAGFAKGLLPAAGVEAEGAGAGVPKILVTVGLENRPPAVSGLVLLENTAEVVLLAKGLTPPPNRVFFSSTTGAFSSDYFFGSTGSGFF
jgi:hypothetical protein